MKNSLCSTMAWAYLRYAPDARYTRILVKIRNALIIGVCTIWVGLFLLFMGALLISTYIHRNDPRKEEIRSGNGK